MNVAEARAADASVAAARKWLLRKRLSQGGFLFGIRWREGSRRRGAIADEKRADEGLSSDQELRRGSRIKGTRRRHQARVRKQVLYVTAGGGKCRNFKFPAAPLARRQPQSAEALSGRLRPMGVVPCRVQTPNTARRRPARRSQKTHGQSASCSGGTGRSASTPARVVPVAVASRPSAPRRIHAPSPALKQAEKRKKWSASLG